MESGRIEREVLRNAVLESLRRQPPQQYANLASHVAAVLAERGLPTEADRMQGYPPALRRVDERRFREIVWQLINQGILVQGLDASKGGADVYDPDGYLRELESNRPLDDIERSYLGQASAALRADLSEASAVMLGAASEHLLILLAEAIVAADPTGGTRVQRALNGHALAILGEVRGYLEAKRSRLPRRLAENLDTTFLGVANVIRTSRNNAGHPALPQVDREEAFVRLRLLPAYRQWVYAVIDLLPL